MGFLQRGGLWVIGQFAVGLTVVVLGVACPGQSRPWPVFLGGLLLLVVAVGCGLAGGLALGRNLTPFPEPLARTKIVQHGIYGRVRHPLYTAVLCAALGWSLVRASWPALAAALALAVLLDAKARYEERRLRRQFPDYAAYAQRVRRFLPWIY